MNFKTQLSDSILSFTVRMDDVLDNFGRKRSSPYGSPIANKRPVKDPGAVQVEFKCCRSSVEAKWPFGAEKMKADLLAATVPGFTHGLVWNAVQKTWLNQDRDSVPPAIELTCPSLDLLKALCHACKESAWCSHWYITGKDGRNFATLRPQIGFATRDHE